MRFVLEKEMCYTVNKTEESKEKKEGKENEDRRRIKKDEG